MVGGVSTYVGIGSLVRAWTLEGHVLMASLVNDERTNCVRGTEEN
jgi:hypothetical protein